MTAGPPTRAELERWFAENYDGEIEYHAATIRKGLDLLLTPREFVTLKP